MIQIKLMEKIQKQVSTKEHVKESASLWKVSLLCSVASFLLYVNTFNAEFVFDDHRAIVRNRDVTSGGPIGEVFVHDFWGTDLRHSGSHGSYRPLTVLSFRINHEISGLNAAWYHVTNVILHSLATFLFCCVTQQLVGFDRLKTIVAGMLFALHPVHTEAVSGIVGRADVLAALFSFATLICYDKSARPVSAADPSRCHPSTFSAPPEVVRSSSLVERKKRKRAPTKKSKRKAAAAAGRRIAASRKFYEVIPEEESNDASNAGVVDIKRYDKLATGSGASRAQAAAAEERRVCTESGSCSDTSQSTNDSCENVASSSSSNDVTLRRRRVGERKTTTATRRETAAIVDGDGGGLRWLATACACAATALLCKEQGYCALPVCIVHDLLVRHRLSPCGVISLLFSSNQKLPTTHRRLSRRVWATIAFSSSVIAARVLLPVVASPDRSPIPDFSPADNPAAASDERATRALTVLYVWSRNVQLLALPQLGALSFDWSMDAVPLVRDVGDPRNAATSCLLIGAVALFAYLRSAIGARDQKVFLGSNVAGETRWKAAKAALRAWIGDRQRRTGRAESSCRRRITEVVPTRTDHDRDSEGVEKSESSEEEKRRSDTVIFGTALSLLSFLPASNIFFYVGFVIAERVLYLTSAGVCVVVAEIVAPSLVAGRWWWHGGGKLPSAKQSLGCVALFAWLIASVGQTWRRNYEWQNELALYSSGIQVNPAKAWANLGKVYRDLEEFEKAESAYLEALRHRDNMADTHYNLGLLYQDTGRHVAAERSYRKAILYRPRLAVAHLNLGVIAAANGRAELAEATYRRTADLSDRGLRDPVTHRNARTAALYNLGMLLADQGRHVEAVDSYRRACDLSRRGNYLTPHCIYNMLGQSLLELDRIDEAERCFLMSIELNSTHVSTYVMYGQLLHHTGRLTEAEYLYKRAVKLEPDSKDAYVHYSQLQSSQGRMEASLRLIQAAARTSAGNRDYDVTFRAATAHREAGDYERAEEYYRKSIALKPELSTAHMNLGGILHLRGELELAERSYLRALQLKPGDQLIESNLAKLRRAAAVR